MTTSLDRPAALSSASDTPSPVTPCPLGCGRSVAAQADAIHYCVTKVKGQPTQREYVGTWDGQALFYGDNYHAVELQLEEYRLGLLEQGLVDTVPASIYARPAEVSAPIYVDELDQARRDAILSAPAATLAALAQDAAHAAEQAKLAKAQYATCTAHGCTNPATVPGLIAGLPLCAACATAGTARLHRPPPGRPRCPVCADPLDAPGLCEACQEAGEAWPAPMVERKIQELLTAWVDCADPTPYDAELAALARAIGARPQLTPTAGQMLLGEYYDDCAGFLRRYAALSMPLQADLHARLAEALGGTVGDVVEFLGKSRARAIDAGVIAGDETAAA